MSVPQKSANIYFRFSNTNYDRRNDEVMDPRY